MQKEKTMAKKKVKRHDVLVLEAINYKIIGLGLAIIVAGYFALSATPWDNPVAMTIAPILLVTGYCVVIPFGIIYRKKGTVPSGSVVAGSDQAQSS